MQTRNQIIPLLKKYLPTFCYQTAQEILTFMEKIPKSEDVDYFCVKTQLYVLIKRGDIIARKVQDPKPKKDIRVHPRYEYIRNPNWK